LEISSVANEFDEFDTQAVATPTGNPFDEFDAPAEKSSLIRRAVGDTGVSLTKGVLGVAEAAQGIADIPTLGAAGKVAEGLGFRPKAWQEKLSTYYSPEQQEANRKVSEADGFVDTVKTAVQNPSTIIQAGIESAPLIVGGGVVGMGARALKASPVIAGAIGEGVVGAGIAAERTRQETDDGLLTGKQAALAAASGVGTAAFGAFGGRLAQKLGITDVDTLAAGGKAAGADKGLLRRVVEGGIAEGVFEELPQSIQEQVLSNAALDKPLLEGVDNAAAMGLLTGAAIGGGVAGLSKGNTIDNDTQEIIDQPSTATEIKPIGEFEAFVQEADADIENRKLQAGIKKPENIDAADVLGGDDVSNIEQGAIGVLDSASTQVEPNQPGGSTVVADNVADGLQPSGDTQIDASAEPAGMGDQPDNSLDAKANEAATSSVNDLPEPTQAQKEAGNYKVGRTKISGLDVSIENPDGSLRKGVDPDGKAWERPMRGHYGYVKGVKARAPDKEHIDVNIKTGTAEDYAGDVYVINQIDPKTGKFDEPKVYIGYASQKEAEDAYRSNYDPSWNGMGSIAQLPLPKFKEMLNDEKAFLKPLNDTSTQQGESNEAADTRRIGENQELQSKTVSAPPAQGATKERSEVKPIIEVLVKRRAAAQELNREKQFDVALKAAKAFMNGEDVSPAKFKTNASLFKNDLPLNKALNDLFELASGPSKEVKANKTKLIDGYKTSIANAKTQDELQTIAGVIQADKNLSDAQAAALDDIVFDAQDVLEESVSTNKPERRAAGDKRVERRSDKETRKNVGDMSAAEMRRALLIDDLTGLGNRRAYDEAVKKDYQVSIDADGLKWINDNLGHESGDILLGAIGEAIGRVSSDSFHISGDEFIVQSDTEDAATEAMQEINNLLAEAVVEGVNSSGDKVTLKGIGISYGIAKDLKNAETKLQQHKSERESAGLRSGRGEQPANASIASQYVENNQDNTTSQTDPLGQDTTTQPELADTEKAKDAKRNAGKDNKSPATQDLFADAGKVVDKPSEAIKDLGEKIGGARKDTASTGGAKLNKTPKTDDGRPTWAKRYNIHQVAISTDKQEEGTWSITDSRNKDWRGQAKQIGKGFATKEAAEEELPSLVVGIKHRVYATAKRADDTYGYEIYRSINDRKRVKVVDKVFDDRNEALAYMGDHATEILETNTTFGETDLPTPEITTRFGVPRRDGDVEGKDFMESFGLRGVEFGNWNNQIERQQLMNAAYDGLLDLAEVLNIPSQALGLNGDLALAFGARGQGLSSAKAHYERSKVVINLTKMNGAGSLAHEFFHALDHYFARQGGQTSNVWEIGSDGTRSLKANKYSTDFISSGFSYQSQLRPELIEAYKALMQTMIKKGATYVEDTVKADNFVAQAKEQLAQKLDRLRKDLSEQRNPVYGKRKSAPASAEQLVEFDTVAAQLLIGEGLDAEYKANDPGGTARTRSRALSGRRTNDALEKLSAIYKDVRGRSGFDSTNNHGVMDYLRQAMSLYSTRLKMLAEAQNGDEKIKQVPTDFAMNARALDEGRGADYWTTPHEMAARAFQGYVEDKIAENGGSSPFMNYGRENAGILTPWGVQYPFPRGEERKQINAALDKFVSALQTKETDTGTALFSRSAMKSVDANIARGEQSMNEALINKADVKRGMYNTELGWIDLVWGNELKGIQHIIRQRMVKDGLTTDEVYKLLTKDLVKTIASGQIIRNNQTEKSSRLVIKGDGNEAVLVKSKGENGWLLTGFKISEQVNQGGGATIPSLRSNDAIRSRINEGAVHKELSSLASGNVNTSFSRSDESIGMPKADVNKVVTKLSAKWNNAPQIVVVDDMNDSAIPQPVRDENERQLSQGANGQPDGFFYKGKVYVVASQMNGASDVQRVIFHETLGHFGLRGTFGKDMEKILNEVATLRRPLVAAKAKQYGLDMSVAKDRLIAAEEVLAEMAQTNPQLGFVKRAIAAIRTWLRENGFKLQLTDDDIIANYLLPARQFVERGGKEQSMGNMVGAFARRDFTETESFKKWFGDSKVVDEDGKPLVVYHGTGADFDTFNTDQNGMLGKGTYFTSVFEEAAEYAADKLGIELSGENDYGGDWIGTHIKAVYLNITDEADITTSKWGDGNIYVARKPNQIKSATGNNGDFDGGNPDIRFSRSSNQSFDIPEDSKLDTVIQSLQDKNIDLKRVSQNIKKASGQIDDRWNAYLQEELYHGRTAKRTQDFIKSEIEPLINEMRLRGVTMPDFEEYLWARHAEERNLQIAKINPDMPDGGSGMTTKEARDYLASVPADKKKAYEALSKRVDAITNGTRQTLVNYGIEEAETIEAWGGVYKNYVPLMREDMDRGFGNGTGQGYSVKGNSSKRATGSNRAVVDILANLAQQREKAIIRGEKNRVSTALIGLAKLNPNVDFWKTDSVPKIKTVVAGRTMYEVLYNGSKVEEFTNKPAADKFIEWNGTTGYVIKPVKTNDTVEEVADPNYKNRDNVVVARVLDAKGKVVEQSVVFNEFNERAMRMAASLKNLDQDQIGVVLSNASVITRYFSSINTQYNPIFGIINIVRDVQGALLNLTSTALAGKQKAVLANTASAMKGIYKEMRQERKGVKANTQWSDLWEEFQSEGGQTGYRDMFKNARDRAESMEHALDPEWWKKEKWGKAVSFNGSLAAPQQWLVSKPGKALFDWLSDYNTTLENSVRLAAYKVAKDEGMSKQQAASLAKNLTVNFNRKGAVGAQIGSLYAFFNASVQGTARIAETLFTDGKLSKVGKQIVGGGLLLGAMQALLLAGFDEDEPPEFVRDRNLIMPVGDGKYLTFPMPLGFNVIPGYGRVLTEWALAGFAEPQERFVHLLDMTADMFNPIGNAGLSIQTLAPTVIDPVAALSENKDFSGRPIAREDFNSLDPTPGFTRAKDTASAMGKALAYGINFISGGTDFKPGAISPTPDQIDYLIGQVTGGVGREAMKVEQTATSMLTGEALPSHKIPIAGRFYGDADGESAQGNAFYNNLRELNEHENEITGLRKLGKDTSAYRKEHPESSLIMLSNHSERAVQKLRKQRRALIEKDVSKEAIERIDSRITEVMRGLNDKVKLRKEAV
jgi:GGDEF domain-containing protein